jgi:hypothetical protein
MREWIVIRTFARLVPVLICSAFHGQRMNYTRPISVFNMFYSFNEAPMAMITHRKQNAEIAVITTDISSYLFPARSIYDMGLIER